MKHLPTAIILMTLAVIGALATDNYRELDKPYLRSTESGGIHTPHVKLGSGTTITTGQVSITTTATQVVASDTRNSVVILNQDAAINMYIGVAGVTSSTGILLKAGSSITITNNAAVFAVAASGTPVAGYLVEK